MHKCSPAVHDGVFPQRSALMTVGVMGYLIRRQSRHERHDAEYDSAASTPWESDDFTRVGCRLALGGCFITVSDRCCLRPHWAAAQERRRHRPTRRGEALSAVSSSVRNINLAMYVLWQHRSPVAFRRHHLRSEHLLIVSELFILWPSSALIKQIFFIVLSRHKNDGRWYFTHTVFI